MKALTKKVVAVALALCMCFALCCTAFAASSPETTGSITINGAIANETYTIYQIFELTYTDYDTTDEEASPDSYSYKVCNGWEDFLATQTVNVDGNNVALFTLTENGYLDPDSLIFSYEDNSDVVAAFARAALAYAENEENNITGTSVSYSYTVNDEGNITATLNPQNVATITNLSMDENGYVTGELTFNNLSLGYYLVGTSLGSLCMLDSADPDAVVNEKNSTPVISKHVYNTADNEWELEDHENNGSTVTYELDVDHITGAVNLVIHDSQPSELEEDWNNFHPEVTLVDDASRTLLAEDVDYTIVLTGANNADCSDNAFGSAHDCTFEIDFTNYDFSNVSEDAYIEVIYTATLNTEGDIYTDDFDEIDNWAVVTFGTSSASPIVEAEVYSFGFEIFKYTGDIFASNYNEVIIAPFSNDNPAEGVPSDELYLMLFDESGNVTYATFELYNEDQNIYVITGWVEDEDGASFITEPDYDTGEQTAYFFVPNEITIPEHTYIQLDEDASNPDQETNDGAEIVSASELGHALADAEFEVTREVTVTDETTGATTTSTQTAYFLYEGDLGIYLFEGWLAEGETVPEGYTTSVTSASDGMIYIEGLDTGTYIVTEIAAPDGYNLLDDSIYVTIWAEYDGETGAISDHGVTWTLGEGGDEESGVVNVENNAGAELPGTGGMGVYIFYIVGGCLVVAAAVVLITRRRVNRAE